MIEKIDALDVFEKNLTRTNMLIHAVEKIRGYNRIYQSSVYEKNLEYGRIVEEIQLKELVEIESTCSEQAIISLATLWETYIKALLANLLSVHSAYFTAVKTKFKSGIILLVEDSTTFGISGIEDKLTLRYRFDYYKFFNDFNIPLLTPDEHSLVEYIFILRNSFIHSSGIQDEKTEQLLRNFTLPIEKLYISTQSKQLRTKIKRLIPKIQKRVFQHVKN